VTTAMRRTIVMIAATTLLVAGCSTGQGDPKVAVVVGGSNVSTVDQVQKRLNDLLASNPLAQEQAKQHKLDQVSRGIVTQEVLHVLAAEAAKRENIQVDESLLPQLAPLLTGERAAGNDPFRALVDAAFDSTELTRDRLILAQLGRKALGRSVLTIDGVLLNDGDEARALAKQIAAKPSESSELVQKAENPLQQPFVDQTFGAPPANVPPGSEAEALQSFVGQNALPFMGAPEKSVVLWRLTGQQGGYAVIYVKKRTTVSQPPLMDLTGVQPAEYVAVGQAQLLASAWQQGVKPNQRYGVWDPVELKVVPTAEASVANLLLPATAAKP
jgi:hypothetical protein